MKNLSCYTSQKQSDLWERTGSFFAFSTEQFNEKKKEGVKYVSMGTGTGLLVPKEHVKEVVESLTTIHENGIDEDVKENGAEAIIQREYLDYECQITCDSTDAREALAGHIERYPELFTPEALTKGFRAAFEYCKEHDLF